MEDGDILLLLEIADGLPVELKVGDVFLGFEAVVNPSEVLEEDLGGLDVEHGVDVESVHEGVLVGLRAEGEKGVGGCIGFPGAF